MTARLLKSVFFSIDDNEFQDQVDDVNCVPGKPVTWRGLDPAAIAADTPVGETKFNIKGIQDYETVGSLSVYLQTHAGEIKTVIYSPRAAGTAYYTVDVVIAAPQIGGALNLFGKVDLQLECATEPATTEAP
jgi:hypothetical protein